MSLLGSHKARITKAAKALRKEIIEVNEAILEPLDPTTEAGKDPQFILSRKSLLFLKVSFLDRAAAQLRAQREKAEEFARQHPDEQGEFPYLQQIQDHWDAGELDQLLEEADTLRLRLDVAIKLLPSSEALYSIHASIVPTSVSSVAFSPHPAQDPSSTDQPAQDVRVEIRSHSSSQDQDRPSEPDAVAPADTLPPARASSASQGFGIPLDNTPTNPPTFANPPTSNPQPNPLLPLSSSPNVNSLQSSLEQSLKLPAFEIPTFHGEIERFFEFWDLFSTAVHNNTNVPVPVKFMYLKSHVRGPAASIIAGFQSTAENYDEAVRILTNTYGRPEILRNKLWDKLMHLPSASDSPLSQRATLCAVKATWTQLQHLKEDFSAIGTLKIIRAKFPRRTRERIGEYKKKGDPMWTVDELLVVLDTIVDRLENVEDADPSDSHSYNTQSAIRHSPLPGYEDASRTSEAFTRYRSPSYSRRSSASRTPSPRGRQERSSTLYYPRRASNTSDRSRHERLPVLQCLFCHDSGHSSDRCRTFATVRQRRVFVTRNKLCWLCLRPNHSYLDCDAPFCSYCGNIHHKALCIELSTLPRSPSPEPRSNFYQNSYGSRSPRRVQFDEEVDGSPSRTDTPYPRTSSREYQSRSPSASRRQQSASSSRRTSPARRSYSPTAAVSSSCVFDASYDTTDARIDALIDSLEATGTHLQSSCVSIRCDKLTSQEPRLMVVQATTTNIRTNSNERLTVFLDSGSQCSFIRTALAERLGLSFRNTRKFTTLTLGGHQLSEESSEVLLTLWDQDNLPLQLVLWTRETILTLPRSKNSNDKTIVDFGDRVEVDVLIGIDSFWRVMDVHKNVELPSGLILSHTRFGPVLSGLQRPAVSNSLLAINEHSDKNEQGTERRSDSSSDPDVLSVKNTRHYLGDQNIRFTLGIDTPSVVTSDDFLTAERRRGCEQHRAREDTTCETPMA